MSGSQVFNITTYQLQNLVSEIETGSIALPDLQRPFVWKTSQIRDLFDSLYKGLPTGFIILWKISQGEEFKPIGVLDKSTTPNKLVIDGQQRLTSMFSVLNNIPVLNKNFKEIKPKIAFNPITEEFAVSNSSIEKNPEWINDISEIYTGKVHNVAHSYIKNLNERRDDFELSEDDEELIWENLDRVNDIKHYSFSVLELSSELSPEQVSEIFVRINSKGKSLNQSDFILTLMSLYWEEGRKELEEFCKNCKIPSASENSPYNLIHAEPDPEQILRTIVGCSFYRGRLKYAYLILKGRNLENKTTTEEERNSNFEIFKEAQNEALKLINWHDFIKIIDMIGFVNYELISSKVAFYISYAFYLIGKNTFNLEYKELESLIGRWFVFCILTQRYTGSPESIIEQDLISIKENNNIAETLENIMNSTLTNDFWNITLPERLISSISNNVNKVYIASQIFKDKNVLFSGIKLRNHLSPQIKSSKKMIDKHHIFPKNFLKKQGIDKQTKQNQIANMIYIEYLDNIKISDKTPSEYWFMMLDSLNENKREEIEESYIEKYDLPEEFWKMEYEDFLDERRKLMAESIREYYYNI